MKKFKKALPFALATVMLLLGACGTTTNTNDYPPAADNPPNYEQPVTLPEDIDIDDDIDVDYDTDVDADYVWPTIFVNGEGLPGVGHRIVGDDIFPTHVPLFPIAAALGVEVYTEDMYPMNVILEGLNGRIFFTIGSEEFSVDGETVTLNLPALEIDNEIYVPIPFFRDVFGGSAFSSAGEVHISADGEDMM